MVGEETKGVRPDGEPIDALARRVIDSLLEGLQLIGPDYRYLYVNETVVSQGRKARHELIGRRMSEAYPGIDGTEMFRVLRHCMDERTPRQMENEFVYPDGERRWFDLRFTPVPEGVIILSIDITDRKRLAIELERSNRDLSGFARAAAHDLQEPLRKIATFVEQLERDLGDLELPERATQDLEIISRSARRMQALVRDQLALARMGGRPLDAQEIDAGACADAAIERLGAVVAESGPQLSRDRLPRVRADRELLTQIYQNLISNALKFRGGSRPAIRFTAEQDGGDWILGVKDDGIGIDPRHLDDIFLPLKRLHAASKYPGTGIGLALCKKAVERHGGRIWAESEGVGHGCHVRFVLPESGAR